VVVHENDSATDQSKYETDIVLTDGDRRILIEEEVRLTYWDRGDFAPATHVPAERYRKLTGDIYMQVRSDGKACWTCPTATIAECKQESNDTYRSEGEAFYVIPDSLVDIYSVKSDELVRRRDNVYYYLENLLLSEA
jgi:hypothetical protein